MEKQRPVYQSQHGTPCLMQYLNSYEGPELHTQLGKIASENWTCDACNIEIHYTKGGSLSILFGARGVNKFCLDAIIELRQKHKDLQSGTLQTSNNNIEYQA